MIKIGLLKEIKVGEGRVALIPKDVKALVDAGHWVGCGERRWIKGWLHR